MGLDVQMSRRGECADNGAGLAPEEGEAEGGALGRRRFQLSRVLRKVQPGY